MSSKRAREKPAANPAPAEERPTAVPRELGWGLVRTALTLFGLGWILIQAAALLRLSLQEFGPGIEPVVVEVGSLVASVALLAGVVYFLTGMAMIGAVPASSGARRPAWAVVGCLVVGAAAWLLLNAASFQNREIVNDIVARIRKAQEKDPKAGRLPREELERELARQWGPDVMRGLTVTLMGALCLAKLLFSGVLWMIARHLRQEVLASGLVIYLLAEALAAAVVVSIFLRRPAQQGSTAPFTLITGDWFVVAITSAFCAWFLVYLFLVRRAITRTLLNP
jgi:hypothetical protein